LNHPVVRTYIFISDKKVYVAEEQNKKELKKKKKYAHYLVPIKSSSALPTKKRC